MEYDLAMANKYQDRLYCDDDTDLGGQLEMEAIKISWGHELREVHNLYRAVSKLPWNPVAIGLSKAEIYRAEERGRGDGITQNRCYRATTSC